MLALYLLVVAMIVGVIASQGNARSALLYVPVALFGALLGAFAAFGDVPFLIRYPLVNPFTLAFASSVGVVAAVKVCKRRGMEKR